MTPSNNPYRSSQRSSGGHQYNRNGSSTGYNSGNMTQQNGFSQRQHPPNQNRQQPQPSVQQNGGGSNPHYQPHQQQQPPRQPQQQYNTPSTQQQQLTQPEQPQNIPQQPPQNPPQNPTQQPQPNLQQEMEALRRKLAEKEEENFELSASLMSIQVETKHEIGQVEHASKQQISKLEGDLRRAQRDANRARSALKKQQQQQPVNIPPPPQQQAPPQPVQTSAGTTNRPLSQGSKPLIPTSNGSISPSPLPRVENIPNAPEPMDLDPPHKSNPQASALPTNNATLVRHLLQELPSGNDRVQAVLTQMTLQGRGSEEDIIWSLVQESVDYANPQALRVLHTVLLWNPKGCQALLQAAGWETPEPSENKAFDPTRITGGSSTIRLIGSSHQPHKSRLESIAAKLKQPLASSQHNIASCSKNTVGSTPFTPKQELLARQLMVGLTEAIYPTKSATPFPHKESLRILTRLLSTIQNHGPSMDHLEAILLRIESRMRAHRHSLIKKEKDGAMYIRGYDALKPADTDPKMSPPSPLAVEELDPMLIEVCCQIDRLVPTPKADDDNDPTKEFGQQWRKAVLANACDLLENRLLPLLLKIGTPIKVASPPLEPAWLEWIPWIASFVKEESGRQLLRVQFPLVAVDSAIEKPKDVSCSAMGIVLQLLYASVMVEQSQVGTVDPPVLMLCQTLRDQAIRCIHVWLQCYKARQSLEISFFDLVSEYSDYYKSACAWILHQYQTDPEDRKAVDPDIASMIKAQMEELVLDEEDNLQALEEKYANSDSDDDYE